MGRTISIFDERGRNLEKIGEGFFAANAHTIAVDQRTHRVYFPLQNVGGKPVLRIALPSDKQLLDPRFEPRAGWSLGSSLLLSTDSILARHDTKMGSDRTRGLASAIKTK